MSLKTTRTTRLGGRLTEGLLVTALYYGTARLGQLLAIPPGNVTPVWIPSGIMLALVLLRGRRVWPGIFLGAFIGNVWAYFDASTASRLMLSLFTGAANGIGDLLCASVAAWLIQRRAGPGLALREGRHAWWFMINGAVLGPGISALAGVGSLCLAGFLPWGSCAMTLVTWWIGDGVGVLLLTPLIMALVEDRRALRVLWSGASLLFFGLLISVTLLALNPWGWRLMFQVPLLSTAPLLIWAALRARPLVTYFGVALVAGLAIGATAVGVGPFVGPDLNRNLMNLQWFIAVLSLPFIVLSALVREALDNHRALADANAHLEARIRERTAALKAEVQVRTAAEAAQQETIEELERALVEIQSLRSILPLCSFCRKVREDDGGWAEIETYITQRLRQDISHGICPDCLQEQYPEFAEELLSAVEDPLE